MGHFAYSALTILKCLFDLFSSLELQWSFSKLCHFENIHVFFTQPFEIMSSVSKVVSRLTWLYSYKIESFLHIQITSGRSTKAM